MKLWLVTALALILIIFASSFLSYAQTSCASATCDSSTSCSATCDDAGTTKYCRSLSGGAYQWYAVGDPGTTCSSSTYCATAACGGLTYYCTTNDWQTCGTGETCSNGVCTAITPEPENTETTCSDSIDNDLDTFIDCADTDCDYTDNCKLWECLGDFDAIGSPSTKQCTSKCTGSCSGSSGTTSNSKTFSITFYSAAVDSTANRQDGTTPLPNINPCAYSGQINKAGIDDEGSASIGGSLASNWACSCNLNDYSGSNCAAVYPGSGTFNPQTDSVVSWSVQNDCKYNNWVDKNEEIWGEFTIFYQSQNGYTWDGVDCKASTPTPQCGNNKKEGAEECDDPDLGGNSCTSQYIKDNYGTYTGGTLKCYPKGSVDECKFDTTSCYTALSVACSPTPASLSVNQQQTFSASPTGGSGGNTYSWTAPSSTNPGPTAYSSTATTFTTSYSSAGSYSVKVDAKDSASQTATASCSVSVSAQCTRNSFSASPASLEDDSTPTLRTSTISWQTSGCSAITICVDSGSGQSVFASGTSGSLDATWIQCGSTGGTAKTYSFYMHNGNDCSAPTLGSSITVTRTCYPWSLSGTADTTTIAVGGTVLFTAVPSGTPKTTPTYAWAAAGGTAATTPIGGGGTGDTKSLRCESPGTITQSVTGSDSVSSKTATFPVVTCSANNAPTLNSVAASPSCVRQGGQFTVSSSASDPDGDSITLSCTGLAGSCPSAATNPSCTYTSAWTDNLARTITCSVSDGQASSSSKSTTIQSDNVFPALGALTITPSGDIGSDDSVTISGSASDSGCGMSSYKIYVDNILKCSGTSSCTTLGQTYSVGTHEIREDAVDVAGNTVSRSTTFEVKQTVSITAISVSPNPATAGSSVTVSCGSSVSGVSCIDASLGGSACTWQSWSGSTAVFSCTASLTCPTTQTATCSVNSATCKPGSTPSRSTSLSVICSPCSSYTTANACNGDTNCEWIYQEGSASTPNACSYPADPSKGAPKRYYNSGTGICLPKGTVTYACTNNKCGATCDANVGCPAQTQCSGTTYQTRSGTCDTGGACACNYGAWTAGTCSQSKTNCGAECGTSADCTPSLVGTTCNYAGACSAACACSYSQQYCPAPGTVSGTTCYYGSQSCTNSGCGLSTCTLTGSQRCDAIQGCVALANRAPVLNSVSASPSCARNSGQFTITSSSSDPDGNAIRLECGSTSGGSELCVGSYTASNAGCTITSSWTDNAAKTVYCRVFDGALYSAEQTTSVTSDNIAPTFGTLTILPAGTIGTDDSVTISGSASDSGCGMSSYKILVDNIQKCSGTSLCTTPGQTYSVGTHEIREDAVDVAGNTASRSTAFEVKQAVSITAISVSPNPAYEGSSVTLSCGSSVSGVSCIDGKLDGITCTFTGWSGSNAVFSCTATNTCPATQTATCSVDATTCKPGATPSMSTTLNVQCSPCSSYRTAVACNRDASCEWIYQEGSSSTPNACSYPADASKGAPKRYYNSGTGICLLKGTVTYACTNNKCGAICDANVGCPAQTRCNAQIYETQTGVCDTGSACACNYGAWTAGTCSQSKANCGAQCETSGDCAANLAGTTCNYAGACSAACACSYSQQYCPAPGTVSGTTCYYGSQSCTNSGCGLSTCTLTQSTQCSATQGCVSLALPRSVINGPAAGWYNSNIPVSVTDTQGDLPISKCVYEINNDVLTATSPSRTCSSTFTVTIGATGSCSVEGTNTCYARVGAFDTNNNLGTTDVRVYSIDYTAPSTSASHSPSLIGPSTSVTISASASEAPTGSGMQRTEIYVDGVLKQTCAAATCSYTTTFASGSHTYYAKGYDNAGNSAQSSTGTINVDSTGPTVSVSSSPAKPYTTDFVVITASASDTAGIGTIDIFVDSVKKTTCTSQTSCVYSQQYSAGTHTLSASATDTLGNSNSLTGTPFYVNSAPVVQPVSAAPNCNPNQFVTLTCPASDADNDIANVKVWAGECAGSCTGPGDASWNTAIGQVYHSGSLMSGTGNGDYTQTFTVNQPPGTKIAGTCLATDANARESNWGDRYPLCTVAGCMNPPAFSGIITTPNPTSAGTVTITFASSRSLQSNPSVNVTPGADQGMTTRYPAAFESKNGNSYTYTFDVLQSYSSGRADISITGTDATGCSGTSLGSFSIDVTPPVTTATCSNATYSGACSPTFYSDVFVTLDAADNIGGTGVKETQYSVDGLAQTGTSFTVSGHGNHTITYMSGDNANNWESDNTEYVNIDLFGNPGIVMEVSITFDKTVVTAGEIVNMYMSGAIIDTETNETLLTCTPIFCIITEATVNKNTGGTKNNLLPYVQYNNAMQRWEAPIDTANPEYRSEVTGCMSSGGLGGCSTGGYSVGSGTVNINIRYPDVDAGVVPVTPTGKPNFTRSMPINFVATGRAVSGISQDCVDTDCNVWYDMQLLGNSPDYTNKQIFWDGFEKGYKGNASSIPLQCDSWYNLWIKMTVQSGPLAGTTNEEAFDFYVNCVPTVTVSPPEARLVLGQQNANIFNVTFWNPKDVLTNLQLTMSTTNPQGYPISWIYFVGTGVSQDGKSATFTTSPLSSTSYVVRMDLAPRSGRYPVDFIVTDPNTGNQYKDSGTILIFAEGLPEFQPWQLLILAVLAPLILWKMDFGESKARRKK